MAICECFAAAEERELSLRQNKGDRRCTDLYCLALFLLFWFLLLFIAVFAFAVGNPLRIIHGADSFGNTCGHKNAPINSLDLTGMDMTDRPYVFHLDQTRPKDSLKICVKRCPTDQISNLAEVYSFFQNTGSSLCRYDFNYTSIRLMEQISARFLEGTARSGQYSGVGPCVELPIMPTTPILYRCVPSVAVSQGYLFSHSVYDFISSYVPLKKVVNDLVNSWREMCAMLIVAIVCAFSSAFVIHLIAGIASWFILISVSVSLLALTVFMWYAYIDTRLELNHISLEDHIPFIKEDDENNEQIILFISIAVTIVSTILFLITFALRTRVRFVVALFDESARCLRSMPLLLLQPLWTLLALAMLFIFWLSILLALVTADNATKERRNLVPLRFDASSIEASRPQLASFTLINYEDPNWIQYMWWYLIVAFIWGSEFILSCQQMVIAGAVSSWYFTRDRSQLNCPIGRSIRQLFSYHLGSVALGSFLITLLKVPRLVIAYMEKKLRGYNNFAAKCCLRGCSCCLWILEKCVGYLNRNAYTVIAIEGTDFCRSAQTAFAAIVTNALRVAAINSIGDFVLFLGKISVAAATALVGAILMKNNPMLHYWTIPVIVVTLIAFWIAHCILSVYEMVIDALFLCFCVDYNNNDGTPGKEYYAPPSLMAFLTGEEVDAALKPLRSNNGDNHPEIV